MSKLTPTPSEQAAILLDEAKTKEPEVLGSPKPNYPPPADQETIAAEAHKIWLNNGCPEGTAESDWYTAETLLRMAAQNPGESLSDG